MKQVFLIFIMALMPLFCLAQENKLSPIEEFYNNLKKLEGKAFEGTVTQGAREGDAFSGKRLVMHVLPVEENRICIPFFVGEDRSRTWILTFSKDNILLKHDHRHQDGTSDKVTMYGGFTSNTGTANMQMFPADQFTRDLIDYAAFNVWWITVDDSQYTYNLQRIGSQRVFTVTFDLTKPVQTPPAAWGWE